MSVDADVFMSYTDCMIMKSYLHLQITVYDIDDDESAHGIDEAILAAFLKGSVIWFISVPLAFI